MKPIMNLKTVDAFVKLEQKYHLLSSDMIDQEELFDIQFQITDMMVQSANADKTGHGHRLLSMLPYLFRTEEVK